jgi:hypothetical protein
MKYIHTLIYTTVVSLAISAQAPNLTSAALGKMEARHIGPAVMSGRTTCIDGVNTEPRRRWSLEVYQWWRVIHARI